MSGFNFVLILLIWMFLPAYMSVHYFPVWSLWRSEGILGSPGTVITNMNPCRVLRIEFSTLEEHPVL